MGTNSYLCIEVCAKQADNAGEYEPRLLSLRH